MSRWPPLPLNSPRVTMAEANMPGDGDFRDLQRRFTAHIRNPSANPAPANLEDRRMAIYRRLVFGNLKSLLGKRFKVIKALAGEDGWNNTIRDFLIKHRASTPLFPELGREFVQYLQDHYDLEAEGHYPFMLELAHYEWLETVLRYDEADPDKLDVDAEGDLRTGIPVVSPVAWVLGYAWPVHRIRPEFIPEEKPQQPTWLMIYRNARMGVSFMELTPGTARLCQLLKDNLQDNQHNTGHDVLEQLATEVGRPGDEKVINTGHQQLLALRKKGIILGTQNAQ